MTTVRILLRLFPVLVCVGWLRGELSSSDREFFENRIRPVLVAECYECHAQDAKKIKGGLVLDRRAGWMKGGDSGPVIVPGDPDGSLLLRMVEHDPDYDPMPPKSKLAERQLADLREWVRRGAPDPRLEELGEEVSESDFDLEARKSWWSLQPVEEVVVPEVDDEAWPSNAIDRFILAKLEEEGWKPAPRADKERLLRRVTLALTGLAPTEEELAAFCSDASPDAYGKVVDRLLASPHFGERWARYWMDVVRFGETKAFEQDYTMPFVDRYRDYLIRAFNEDVPYDQFVEEALAGDLLAEPRIGRESGHNESVAGPGYLYLTDGQHGPPDLHGDEARVFDSIINTTSVAFQGITLACARCHDHKFDAITAADYYSFYGMLRSSRLHYANRADPVAKKTAEERLGPAKTALVSEWLAAIEAEASRLWSVLVAMREIQSAGKYAEWREALRGPAPGNGKEKDLEADFRKRADESVAAAASRHGVDAGFLMRWLLWVSRRSVEPELAVLHGLLNGEPLERLGETANRVEATGEEFAFGLDADGLGDWIATGPGFRPARGDGFVPATQGERSMHAVIGAGAVAGLLSPRLDGVLRSPDFQLDGGRVELWVRGRHAAVQLIVRNYELAGYGPTTNRLRVTVDSDRWRKIGFDTRLWKGLSAYLEVQHDGDGMKCIPKNAEPAGPSDDAWAAVAAGALPQWGKTWLGAAGGDDPARALAGVIGGLAAAARQGTIDGAGAEALGALAAAGLVRPDSPDNPALLGSRSRFRELAQTVPKPVYVRSVTDGQSHHEPVYIRGDHKHPSKEPNPRHFFDGMGGRKMVSEGSGRLEWAELVADPANPLTARVRVNRIWSRLFGRGLVASVDDFGKMGDLPTHPELLDFLASEFVREGWSTKRLIRRLVLSSTYRMDSRPGEGVAEADPKNLLLQHMPVRRMDAESIRDHILACSGGLKRDLYGPGVPAYVDDQPASRAKPRSGPLDGGGRRSIYLEMRRNFLPSFLRVFDMPNATEPAGRRNVTNVPAQALALMNDRFVHEQARGWAGRILQGEGSTEERLQRLHRRALGREAGAADLAWGRRVLDAFAAGDNPEEAWTALCHLMINRKEFIYVF